MVKIRRSASMSRPHQVWPTTAVVLATLMLPTLGCTTVEYADNISQQNPLDAIESDLLVRLNTLRTNAGVPTVEDCATLNTSASRHSDDMRDKGYLSDVAPDASTPVKRACDAGFESACANNIAMAELLAKGNAEAGSTIDQWAGDATTAPILTDPTFTHVGIGRAMGGESAIWTVDFAASNDPSCTEPAP